MRHEDHWRLDPKVVDLVDASFRARHGHGGEWRVEKQRLQWDILDAFARAAEQAGIPATDDFNGGNNEGVGYFEVNQRSGLRWNTARAFLRPTCYGRPNFEMWTGVQVEQLVLERRPDGGQHCTGARVRTPHGMETVRASDEVLLCAGAIGSVQVLQLTGIGDPGTLHAAGVTPRHELRGVGRNLQDHLQIRAVYKVRGTRTLNTRAATLWGKVAIGLEYALRQTGPMSMAPSQLGAFTKSDPRQAWPNLQYHVQPLSLDAFGEPLHHFDAFTASVCNLNPESRGEVHIRSPRAQDAPRIAPNYLSTEQDRLIAANSLRLTRRIAGQPALAPYQPQEWKPGPQFESDADLARMAGEIGTTIFHPVGTCRMGRADDTDAVVDPHLRVRGIGGLRVVDASVMPTITSGNTNSPTLMIAERAAEWIARGQ
jgi:choline dehydrogenase